MNGRKSVFDTLQLHISKSDCVIWFHTASLGEFEQGLPLLEALKNTYPNHKFLLTFFSPSGYEVKKNSAVADVITYLPLDTKANAKKFLELAHPEFVIFVKYEFWPNYLAEIKKQSIDAISISAIFRKEQLFFKSYGGWMRKSLHAFKHIFVQDTASQELLSSIGYHKTTVSGDTRFDRVLEILQQDNSLPFIENFVNDQQCVVIGSSWAEDEAIYIPFINSTSEDIKFIIAPHNIKTNEIQRLRKNLTKKVLLYSEMENVSAVSEFEVFIIDTIGLLTKIYSYADIAYVGGGMGKTGLHNTLEPAVFGIPVIVGKNYKGFKEAKDLVEKRGIISIKNREEFEETLTQLLINDDFRSKTGAINQQHIQQNGNAVTVILDFIKKAIKIS